MGEIEVPIDMYVRKSVIIKVHKNKNPYSRNHHCDKLYMDYLDFTTYTGHLSPPMLNWYNIRHLLVTVTEWHISYLLYRLVCFIVERVHDTHFVFLQWDQWLEYIYSFYSKGKKWPMCSVYKFIHRNVTKNCKMIYMYKVQGSTVPQNCKFNSQLYNICNYFIIS